MTHSTNWLLMRQKQPAGVDPLANLFCGVAVVLYVLQYVQSVPSAAGTVMPGMHRPVLVLQVRHVTLPSSVTPIPAMTAFPFATALLHGTK